MYPTVELTLPHWVAEVIGDPAQTYATLEARMDLAIRLAARNIEEGGGPFGAGVFDMESGRLVAPGVNRVLSAHCSVAHAEALAIMVAQQACGTFDLSADALPPLELVTSAQPCIQCFGILWWSGVRRVVIGATKEDVEALTGFVEGPLPLDWEGKLASRDPLPAMAVVHGVLRSKAREVLRRYAENGGVIYNSGGKAKV